MHADAVPHPAYTNTARKILIGLALVNAIPLLFVTSSVLAYALLAAAGIYLPAYFLDRLDAKGQ